MQIESHEVINQHIKIAEKNRLEEYFPYIATVVLLFQVPFQVLLIDNIHLYIIIIMIGFLFLSRLKNSSVVKLDGIRKWIFIIILWIPISAVFLPSLLISMVGSLDYLLPLLFWVLFLDLYEDRFSFQKYLTFTFALTAIMALFGIYQRFFDPGLFGIMESLNTRYSFETINIVKVFRISSFCSSTQVFSFLMGANFVVAVELWDYIRLNKLLRFICISLIAFSGILAGGKVFALMFLIGVSLSLGRFIRTGRLRINTIFTIGISFIVFASLLIVLRYFDIINVFSNAFSRTFIAVLDYGGFLSQEGSRQNAMSTVFQSSLLNAVFGHGLGTSSYSAYNLLGSRIEFSRVTLESYVLSVYYEMGVIGLFFFFGFYLRAVVISFKKKYLMSIIAIFAALFVTPSYFSISMFPITGFFVFMYYNKMMNEIEVVR